MGWRGTLRLDYRRDAGAPTPRTVVHDRHEGPLRVLASLYPEGPAVCHSVLVHPPGGIGGGGTLDIGVALEPGAHALVTTPGATRFYRSAGAPAAQTLVARVADCARLEWLPLETIAYAACEASNALRFDEGTVAGGDRRLLDSPLGFAGRSVLATLWFASGGALGNARIDALLDSARACAVDGVLAGATAPERGVVVVRAPAARVEPAMALLAAIRGAWRRAAWGLEAAPPRIWRT